MSTCIKIGCAAQACFRDLIFLGNCRGESESSAFPDSERYRWLEMLRTPTKRKKIFPLPRLKRVNLMLINIFMGSVHLSRRLITWLDHFLYLPLSSWTVCLTMGILRYRPAWHSGVRWHSGVPKNGIYWNLTRPKNMDVRWYLFRPYTPLRHCGSGQSGQPKIPLTLRQRQPCDLLVHCPKPKVFARVGVKQGRLNSLWNCVEPRNKSEPFLLN
jgi:hypothetical protein